jgi:hypothetical protein
MSTGPTGASTDPQPTEASAQAAFDHTWAGFTSALEQNDLTGMAAYATPGVVNVVKGYFLCGCAPWPPQTSSVNFTAPVETSFPSSFLAEVTVPDYDGNPLIIDAVLTEAAAGAPWLVSFLVTNYEQDLLGTTSAAAMDDLPPPQTVLGPAIDETASFLQEMVTTGSAAGNPWYAGTDDATDGSAIGQLGASLAGTYHANVAQGYAFPVTYSVSRTSVVFSTSEGDVECAEIDGDGTATHPGGTVTQPVDQSEYGVTLAPGGYSSVTVVSARDVCMDQQVAPVRMVGLIGGAYQATGVPAG